MFRHRKLAAALVASLVLSPVAMADAKNDTEMKKLATTSGCMTKQYKGKPGASEFLTRVVIEGSNPYSSHWKGKVSGLSMPPNSVAITEGNARLLVNWILAL